MNAPINNAKKAVNDLWLIIRWVPLVIALTILGYIAYQLWNMELTVYNVEISLTRPTPTPKPFVTVPGTLKDWAKSHPQ